MNYRPHINLNDGMPVRVKLVACNDPFTSLPAGLEGTATGIDSCGTLHVNWDNGSRLGLVWNAGDQWSWIDPAAADLMDVIIERSIDA